MAGCAVFLCVIMGNEVRGVYFWIDDENGVSCGLCVLCLLSGVRALD